VTELKVRQLEAVPYSNAGAWDDRNAWAWPSVNISHPPTRKEVEGTNAEFAF
jgi:hypothetical protein